MKLNQFFLASLILLLPFLFCLSSVASDDLVEETLEVARKQFYSAIEEKKQIKPTIALFERIGQMEPKYIGRAQVYIGALIALKGKHAFFPYTKFKWAKRGLAVMDSGLQKSPNDIEALFIHGMTCYHLPFFFQRSDDAQQDFKKIIKQMQSQVDIYDRKLIVNIIAFLLENVKLMPKEKIYLQNLKNTLESQRPGTQQ